MFRSVKPAAFNSEGAGVRLDIGKVEGARLVSESGRVDLGMARTR